MKRLFGSILLVSLLACVQTQRVVAQDSPPPPPPDAGPSYDTQGPDQAPPPDQGGMQDQAPTDQGGDQGDVSYQTFYDNLSDQGTWVQTDDYGYVFQPNVEDPNWAPYTDGHWVYTDDGWTWVSDEPWGWATYHYGRWANLDDIGWCWVPGYRWAPAWVSWRYGGGYCGWAPLPPDTFIGVEFGDGGGSRGYRFGDDVDVSFGIGAGCYNFLPVGRMGEGNYGRYFVNRSNNFTIINQTTNITNITVNRGGNTFGGVRNFGPPINEVNSHLQRPIQTMRLTASNAPGRSSVNGNAVSFYAPRVNSATVRQARPASVARTINHPQFNRGDSITRPLQVSAGLRPAAPSAEAVQRAQLAQAHAPASAKIATVHTPIRSSRISGLNPVTRTHVANENSGGPVHQNQYQIQHQNQYKNPSYAPGMNSGDQVRHNETAPVYHPTMQGETEVNHTTAPVYHPPVKKQTEHTSAPRQYEQTEHQAAPATYNEQRTTEEYHPASPVQHEEHVTPQHETTVHPTEEHHAPPNAPRPETHAAKPSPDKGNGKDNGKDDKNN